MTESPTDGIIVIADAEYRRHPNGCGLVALTATVAETAFIGKAATVSGRAQVYGDAKIAG